MIIPHVRISWISDEKGYGLIALKDIPKGTVTFVQDGLDIVIPQNKINKIDPKLLSYVDKYSFEDFMGNRIVSWDLGKYMNHDDQANTLTTGYGFEVAVRDIKKGEEVTDDYRIFSTHHDTSFSCEVKEVEELRPWPAELIKLWDLKAHAALNVFQEVNQPLEDFIDAKVLKRLHKDCQNQTFKSVVESLPYRYRLHMQSLESEHSHV